MAKNNPIDGYDTTVKWCKIGERLKRYQFMIEDSFDNLYGVGFYDKLDDNVVNDINEELRPYNVSITLEQLLEAERKDPQNAGIDVICYENADEEYGLAIRIRCFIFE